MPRQINATEWHDFEATFADWKITSFVMDGNSLPERPRGPVEGG
jgi:hypothetical protein